MASGGKTLDGKVVLVTGASRGIGYFAAREAAARGAHVIALARTVGGLEELDDEIQAAGGSTTIVPLDLGDGAAIDRLGAAIFERWQRLDGLIANAAALGTLTPVAHIDPEEFDTTFKLNVTANYRLLRSLDLLLRQAPAGRAVFVSSGVARSALPYWGLYAASKAALETLVKTYAGEMQATSVRANVFNPGPVRTAMRAQAFPGENPEKNPPPQAVAPMLVDMVEPGYADNGMLLSFKTGEQMPL